MSKVPVFILMLLASAVPAALIPGAAQRALSERRPAAPLLRDGFILTGVDGTLAGPDSNDVWSFELASDVNDSIAVLKAGTKLELLPSSALEKMIADAKTHPAATYRLWDGRVTKYKGKNYIFPNYFQPLRKSQDARQKTENESPTSDLGKSDLAVDEPNDVLTLPPELLEKLRARRESRMGSGGLKTTGFEDVNAVSYMPSANTIFADRTAFMVKQEDGRLVLAPDALGRNIQKLTLRLLPCEVLELAEREQSAEPVRFKVAGLITKYKGESYLLLYRANRAYSHSNFGR
jgi:hypothetical protein